METYLWYLSTEDSSIVYGVPARFFHIMLPVQKLLNGDTDAKIWKVMQDMDSLLVFYRW